MDKKQATVGRIAFIHFGRTFGLFLGVMIIASFVAMFLDESIFSPSVMTVATLATYLIVLVAAILYSAHVTNTTYRIDDAAKVVNLSSLYYLIVTVVLVVAVFFATSELSSITSFFEVVLFYGLSKWKIKNDDTVAAPVASN